MLGELLRAVAPRHALPERRRDGERLAREHRRLVGDAHPDQVPLEVEARRGRLGEARGQRRRVAALLDVVEHRAGLLHVEHHEVAPAGVLVHLARGGLGLLVPVLAVDHRGVAVARVALDPLPDVEHRPAGGVHQHAADGPEPLEVADGDAERRHDHDVLGGDPGEVELALGIVLEDGDAHGPELGVHVRVVDDLADQEEAALRKLDTGLVGVVDRAVHPVAEAELAGQPEGERPRLEPVAARPQGLHHRAVVVGGELLLDVGLEPEPAPEVGAAHAVIYTPGGVLSAGHGPTGTP